MILTLLGCVGTIQETGGPRDTAVGPSDDTGSGDSEESAQDSPAPTDTQDDSGEPVDSDDTGSPDTGVLLVTDADFILVGSDVLHRSLSGPVLADWNGDGRLDLGATIYQGTAERGAGDGVAFRVTDLTVGRVETADISERFLGTGTSDGVQLQDGADLDGDGYDDALLQERREDNSGHLAVLSGPFSGDVEFADATYSIYGEPDYPVAQVDARAADLDGDGVLEILAAGYSTLGGTTYGAGSLSAYPATGTGDHDASEATAWIGCANEDDCWGFAWELEIADNNGDGIDDVWAAAYAANDYAGRVYLFEGPFEGARTEADADALRTGVAGSMYGYSVTTGDFDGDGTTDTAAFAGSDDSYEENGAAVYLELGPMTDVAESSILATSTVRGESAHRLGWSDSGDLDGDGRADLAVSVLDPDYRGDLYVWTTLAEGAVSFRSGQVLASGSEQSDDTYPMLIEDVDADGATDIVLRFADEEQIGWCLFYNDSIL